MRCSPAGELVRVLEHGPIAIESEIEIGILEQYEGTKKAGGAMHGAAR